MTKKINIGLAGLGTVGSGVTKIIKANKEVIAKKTGLELNLSAILDIDFSGKEELIPANTLATNDVDQFFKSDIDIVVELIGGKDFAKTFLDRAINEGKHIVTANKALLAIFGKEIFEKINQGQTQLRFEAAVAGAIPIIQTIENSLRQNKIEKIDAILNGTSNYILTRMSEEQISYKEALAQAQINGFAEKDPTFDVQGIDAAHKIAILANLCFGSLIPFDDIYIQGLGDLELIDMDMAKRMGYVIKPLGITKFTNGFIEARVHPTMLLKTHPLASVRLENNAIYYQTDFSGPGLLIGKGAGSLPTASAVLSDIIQIGLKSSETFNFASKRNFSTKINYPIAGLEKINSKFYIRLMTQDRPGILAKISGILALHNISIASVVQIEAESSHVPLTMMTHEANEASMQKALKEIKNLEVVTGNIVLLHVED